MEVYSGSTEEKIIQATFNVLEKEGITGATTKKIAENANVSELTLFRKFKSKQNLIDASKKYYCDNLIEKLEKIFEFSEETSVEDYLRGCFDKVVHLSDQELNILKISIEEVRGIPAEDRLFLKISEPVIKKLNKFFSLKIEQNEIRNITPEILSLTLFSIMFEYIILRKVYGKQLKYSVNKYSKGFTDAILNGIKSNETTVEQGD